MKHLNLQRTGDGRIIKWSNGKERRVTRDPVPTGNGWRIQDGWMLTSFLIARRIINGKECDRFTTHFVTEAQP